MSMMAGATTAGTMIVLRLVVSRIWPLRVSGDRKFVTVSVCAVEGSG